MPETLSANNLLDLKLTALKSGGYEDSQGCYHEDLESALQCGVLGHCGCGNPLDNIKFVGSVLRLMFDHWEWSRSTNEKIDYGPGSRWQAYLDDRTALCGGDAPELFTLYALDKLEFIEHGGSVGGSWPTPKGIAFMEAAERLEGT